MEKQKIDDEKGMTYNAGSAIEFSDTLPIHIQKVENDKTKLLGIFCKFYSYFEKGHKKMERKSVSTIGVMTTKK